MNQAFIRFRNTTFYDSKKFPKALWEENAGPITENNLQISDFYIHFFRNSGNKMDIEQEKFENTIITILKEQDDILKVRSVLLLFVFKNIFDISPYFSIILSEDKSINNFTSQSSEFTLFESNGSIFFNRIFINELKIHQLLMLNIIESIEQLTKQQHSYIEKVCSIIFNIILINEEMPAPLLPNQLIFYDDNVISEFKNKIKESFPIILSFLSKYEEFKQVDTPTKEESLIHANRDDEKVLETVWNLDSINDISNSKLQIGFLSEEDINIESSTREFVDTAITLLFSTESDLFDYRNNNFYWFKYHKEITDDLLNKYFHVGFFLGLIVRNKMTIHNRFPRFFYKKLLNRKVTPDDLTFFDHDLTNSIKSLLDKEVTEDMCIEFSYCDPIDKYTVDLTDFTDVTDDLDHEVILLSDSNKNEYLSKLSEWVFNLSISKEFDAFYNGFMKANVNEMFFKCFRLDELDLIVSGAVERDWNDLKKAAYYVSYDQDSQVIVWFWEYFMNLEEEKKVNVLKFITGSSSIPTEGLGSIRIRFTRLKEIDCLPSIHTCFKEIILPEYTSYEQLEQKCNLAFVYL